ncbi:MAG: flagellin [Lachnospiraceae bacterium]|nr:flagellin [Lachnospiraceae bacterium]
MRINFNTAAVIANKNLNQNDDLLSRSLRRLSSGLKVNEAKDNPAGMAIGHRMDSQVRGLGAGSNNTNDGISVVETADGALSEISSIMQRMSELAVQAGTDTKTDDDRAIIDKEIQQLKQEITRISEQTEFNGQPLLNGNFDLKGYTDDKNVKVQYYNADVPAGKYELDVTAIYTQLQSVGETSVSSTGFENRDVKATLSESGETLRLRGLSGFEMDIAIDPDNLPAASVNLDITGIGAMKIQTGANEGQELAIQIPTVSLKTMDIVNTNVLTMDDAQTAISSIKGALYHINDVRSKLGAYQNRLEHNLESTAVSEENMTGAYSRIMDVDMAEEMTEYTTYQVLTQAGTSMLAQANERPSMVLQLLQ